MKFLLVLLLASGCMSTTNRVATNRYCSPEILVVGDVFVSGLVAGVGVVDARPGVTALGAFLLTLSAINWVWEAANCHHIH